jgi:hypothetical protein
MSCGLVATDSRGIRLAELSGMIRPDVRTSRQGASYHAVRFYENKESLCRLVAEFLSEGLEIGQPALIIGTPEHRAAIADELRARHFDVERLEAAGDMLLLDARTALATFMIDGVPDGNLFYARTTRAIERLCRGRSDCTVRAYGEMVDLLWKDGESTAAVQLEMLWNRLAATHDFSLLCGYAMGNFYKDASVGDICHHHTHVVASDGSACATLARSSVN